MSDNLNYETLDAEQRPTSLLSLTPLDANMNECDTKKLSSPGGSSLSSDHSSSVSLNYAFKRHWGEEITVELVRDQNKGFGISIIGGKDSNKTGFSSITGILIKKILPDSPAVKCGLLKTGDRLLEVGGVSLRNASHDESVEVIKNAVSPVKFVVQSLICNVCWPMRQAIPLLIDFSTEQGAVHQWQRMSQQSCQFQLSFRVQFVVEQKQILIGQFID